MTGCTNYRSAVVQSRLWSQRLGNNIEILTTVGEVCSVHPDEYRNKFESVLCTYLYTGTDYGSVEDTIMIMHAFYSIKYLRLAIIEVYLAVEVANMLSCTDACACAGGWGQASYE